MGVPGIWSWFRGRQVILGNAGATVGMLCDHSRRAVGPLVLFAVGPAPVAADELLPSLVVFSFFPPLHGLTAQFLLSGVVRSTPFEFEPASAAYNFDKLVLASAQPC
jgi:hypothetical protein